jgi:hypothetical protein
LTELIGCFLATKPVYQRMARYSEEGLRPLSLLDITHADYREANWAERRRKKRFGRARNASGSYSIPPRRGSFAIPRVLAFSAIRRRCACSDMTIRPLLGRNMLTLENHTRPDGRPYPGRPAAGWWSSDGTKVPLKILDLHPNTLRQRMSKLGIQRSSHRQS